MRFVIREQEYEKLVASGRLKYVSGELESWRLTEAVDGYMVMRVDLDGREAGGASSTLLHLLLDPDRRLERAKLREISANKDLSVDVLVVGEMLNINRTGVAGVAHSLVDRSPGFGLILPGLVGLALFVGRASDREEQAVVVLDQAHDFEPRKVAVTTSSLQEERLAVTGQDVVVRPYLIGLGRTRQTIWLDKDGLPVRVEDESGLRAFEERYVRHR
jgi:hypothetical protein